MIDIYKAHLKAGYPGKDSMRENALREFDGELKAFGRQNERPGSFSAPSRTPMRLYKTGGHVGKERERTKLHNMQERELGDVKRLIEKEKRIKKANGGSLTNLHMPKYMGYGKSLESQPHEEKGPRMKKGGHMKKHYDHGGHYTEVYGHDKTFKKGGHAHHYASGGNVYENEMLGERESHRMPHLNYESQMRGEHCINHAGMRHEDHMMHDHPSIKGLKHGGRSRYAAGGVAKVRHNQATMSGKQITNAPNRVKVY